MSPTTHWYMPRVAPTLFVNLPSMRRLANVAKLTAKSRVAELGGSQVASWLVRLAKCKATVRVEDEARAERVRALLQEDGLQLAVAVEVGDHRELGRPADGFDAVVSASVIARDLTSTAQAAWRVLSSRGRLAVVAPVRFSEAKSCHFVRLWEERLGRPLLTPAQCLMALEREGYEPDTVEVAGGLEMADHMRALRAQLNDGAGDRDASAEAELAALQAADAQPAGAYALVIGRRKEAAEPLPANRSSG